MTQRLTLQFPVLILARDNGATDRTELLWRRNLLHPPCIA
jgi:hypothetical protein